MNKKMNNLLKDLSRKLQENPKKLTPFRLRSIFVGGGARECFLDFDGLVSRPFLSDFADVTGFVTSQYSGFKMALTSVAARTLTRRIFAAPLARTMAGEGVGKVGCLSVMS